MAFTGAGGENVGEVSVDVTANIQPAIQAVQQLQRELQRLVNSFQGNAASRQIDQITQSTQRAARSAGEARAQFVEMAIGLEIAGRTLTQFVTVPVTRFLRQAVTEASHFNEVVQQTNVILGDSAAEAVEWAETLSASFGLTNSEALESQNNFALLFNEIGVGMEGSVQIAQQLVERIGDLASFKDFPIEQVIQRIQSGLVGETEAVRRLGVILDESVIKQKAYEQGIIQTGEALSTQQKFLLRAQQILEQTSEAQGDAARTADTFAGQMRELRANTADLREELGQAFIPIVTTFITQVNNLLGPITSLVARFAEMDGPLQEIVLGFVAITAALGPLATAGSRIAIILRTITTLGGTSAAAALSKLALQMQATTFAGALLQRGLVGIASALPAIGAGIVGISLLSSIFDRSKQGAEEFDEAITRLKENILEAPQTAAADFLGVNPQDFQEITSLIEQLGTESSGLATILNIELGEGLERFQELVNRGQFALAELVIAEVQDSNQKKQLNDILQEGIRIRRDQLVVDQRQTAINEALAGSVAEVKDAYADTVEELKDYANELKQLDSLERQKARANQQVADAQQRVRDTTDDLNDAQAELNALLAQGTINLERVANAEERLANTRERLAETQQALTEAQQAASPEDLADAEDDVLQAELALNRVRRQNAKAVDDLNKKLNKQVNTEKIGVNLQGLSLDQMRAAINNARAAAEALRQRTDETEDSNDVEKTAAELQDEAIQREIDEREAIRALNDARERENVLKQKGTEQDPAVIAARKAVADATKEVTNATNELNAARQPDEALVNGIAAAEERVDAARRSLNDATNRLREAERERLTTLQDIAIELAFIREDEVAINNALIARYGLNAQLAEQSRQFAINNARQQAAGLLNSLSFDNFGALGRGIAKATFTSPQFIELLAQRLVASPGAPLRNILKSLGVPDSLLLGFKDGGVITRPMVANIGEGYKAEAVVPLTNAKNAIAALQKGWGYMAPQLKQQLAPALAPQLKSRPSGYSMQYSVGQSSRPSAELQTLTAILHRLENLEGGTTTIEAPISISASNGDLQARKVRRELQKLQSAVRGRPDGNMRRR